MSKTDQAALLLKAGKTDAEICIALSCSIVAALRKTKKAKAGGFQIIALE